jgi:aspartate aminotransferase-like enzyme
MRGALQDEGVVASLGAGPARECAARLETMGREARLDDAAPVLAQLADELERVAAFFSAPDWGPAAGRRATP